ncbi:IS630 family transposase [Candidatus Tisiphia endosymbiont of Nedyus quadrimaculatus]|uniref:IS630 family transposase n=1 Tax=Candidatus Tisiphia endosymbiont of Nedyus quadrimaculatus TaxID=3139332 RepID=UPI00345E3840
MPSPYSYDLRSRVIEHYEKHKKIAFTCETFKISRSMLYVWIRLKKQTGDIKAKEGYQKGYGHKIPDLLAFGNLIKEDNSLTLTEIAKKLDNTVSIMTISRALKKLNISKKKTYAYKERDEGKRQDFLSELEKVPIEKRVYLDEAGINDNESYEYGWSMKGSRCNGSKSGRRSERTSFIGALNRNSLIASLVFTGSCDSKVFEDYIENCLVPELKPGQVVIADNASFHKSKRAKELIEKAGCKLKFLPSYSPDLNLIEHHWFPIKNNIRKLLDKGISVFEASCRTFKIMYEPIC